MFKGRKLSPCHFLSFPVDYFVDMILKKLIWSSWGDDEGERLHPWGAEWNKALVLLDLSWHELFTWPLWQWPSSHCDVNAAALSIFVWMNLDMMEIIRMCDVNEFQIYRTQVPPPWHARAFQSIKQLSEFLFIYLLAYKETRVLPLIHMFLLLRKLVKACLTNLHGIPLNDKLVKL